MFRVVTVLLRGSTTRGWIGQMVEKTKNWGKLRTTKHATTLYYESLSTAYYHSPKLHNAVSGTLSFWGTNAPSQLLLPPVFTTAKEMRGSQTLLSWAAFATLHQQHSFPQDLSLFQFMSGPAPAQIITAILVLVLVLQLKWQVRWLLKSTAFKRQFFLPCSSVLVLWIRLLLFP